MSINDILEKYVMNKQPRFYLKVSKESLSNQFSDGTDILRFDIQRVSEVYHIFVQNVSQVIFLQQNLSNQMYHTAMEANFSHEQMTPLNSILSNARIILAKYKEIESTRAKVTK